VSFSWFSGLDVKVFDAILAEPGVPGVVKVFIISSGAKIKYTTLKKLLPQRCTKLALWLVLCNVETKPVLYLIFREALRDKLQNLPAKLSLSR
jgi:hypothetical protein